MNPWSREADNAEAFNYSFGGLPASSLSLLSQARLFFLYDDGALPPGGMYHIPPLHIVLLCPGPLGHPVYVSMYVICSVVSDCIVTPWTVAHQAPLSMEFSRPEYWSGLPFPFPGDLPFPGVEPRSPALQADSSPLSHQGSPLSTLGNFKGLH